MQDSCRGVTEIEVVNVYVQDTKLMRRALEEWRAEHKEIVALARIGAEVDQANLKGFNDPLSQQAQARFFIQRLDILRALDFDGVVIWSFNDWRAGSARIDGPYRRSLDACHGSCERSP